MIVSETPLLHKIRACYSLLLTNNTTCIEVLLLERYYTEFRIYEIGLSQSSDIFTEQPNLRLECLFACLQATKSHGAALINIDPNQFPGLSASNRAGIVILSIRLLMFPSFYRSWRRSIRRSERLLVLMRMILVVVITLRSRRRS